MSMVAPSSANPPAKSYTIFSRMWNGEMFVKDVITGKKDCLHDANALKPSSPLVRLLEEQDERENQKLWYETGQAVIVRATCLG